MVAAAVLECSDASCEAVVGLLKAGDPDLDPIWGLLVDDASPQVADAPLECRDASCEAVAGLLKAGDPDLDPVWGLLVDAAEPALDKEPTAELPEPARPAAEPVGAAEHEEEPSGALEEQVTAKAADPGEGGKKPISNVVDKAEVPATRFPLPRDIGSTVTRREVADGATDAFVLDGVLTKEECSALIERAEGLWSFWDDSSCPRVSFRNAETIEVTHEELADRIWQRVAGLVNPSLTFEDDDDPRFEVDIQGTWQPYAMNPKKLLSKYVGGGHFSPHTDGTTVVDFNRRTFYSCVLFLNESPWGGETRIYQNEQMGKELVPDEHGRLTGDPELILEAVPPAPGRMLVFYHRLMHEGVAAAEKYIVRTDVLYRREQELCTLPEDRLAFEEYQEAQLRAEKGECDEAARLFRSAFRRSPALRQVYRC